MQITYFSDVHLEFGRSEFPRHDGDIVVAAGDIAPGCNAVPWLEQSGDIPVVYVAGNHEFYGEDASATTALLRRRSHAAGTVHFLEKNRFEYMGVRFLGTTLWASFNRGDASLMRHLERRMSDFSYIRCGQRKLRAHDVLHAHHASLSWLMEQLETKFAGPTVVVTHHAPSMRSWHRESDDKRRHAYCSDLEFVARRYSIDLWIHGHTHTKCKYRLGNTTVVCNASVSGNPGMRADNATTSANSIRI